MIVRYLDLTTLETPTAISGAERAALEFQGWVLDSDRLSFLEDIPLLTPDGTREVDLQTDYAPFILAQRENSAANIEQQAEVFVGFKTPVDQWSENPSNPSVPLSLLNSSNHLFGDYQPHNSNVFSMIDEMLYTDTGGNQQKIASAQVSYYAIGWHADTTQNPFYLDALAEGTKRSDRMSNIAMAMKNDAVGNASVWEGTAASADVLCHGAMYGVPWSMTDSITDTTAQTAAGLVAEKTPVAVGTTAVDALITLIRAHVDDDTGALQRLEKDLIAIQTLILAQDDGVDANLQAADLLEDYSYKKYDGGSQWHLGTADGSPPQYTPSSAQCDALDQLNGLQAAADNNSRTMDRISWDLFSIWWKFVSGAIPASYDLTRQVQNMASRWTLLSNGNTSLNAQIKIQAAALYAKQGTDQAYAQRKDPTLLIGGVQAGWAHDYLSQLQIRVDTQTVKPSDVSSGTPPAWGAGWDTFVQTATGKFPTAALQAAAQGLLAEFNLLSGTETISTAACVLPLYHDQLDDGTTWRDRWSTQPWFPLFVEWQAEYHHIDYSKFSLAKRPDHAAADVVRWGIQDDVNVYQLPPDVRAVSGRCLILPQPTLSLATAANQLLTNLGTNVPLPESEVEFLKDPTNYNLMPFLSSTLTGLTPHLTTRIAGTHIKPTQRPRGEQVSATAAALEAGKAIGMGDGLTPDILGTIVGQNTSLTPYGHSVELDASGPSPFKPVTHGQLRFTQINVIDKFGRAICVLDPSPVPTERTHIPLCLSDIYTCQPMTTAPPSPPAPPPPPPDPKHPLVYPNTPDWNVLPGCEYAQLPPSINQPARLNLVFCKPNPADPTRWTPMNDWETPVYGWVVMNYADYGLQFFLPDGTFYRELRFGGPNGLVAEPPWTPYARPSTPAEPTQLDLVVDALLTPPPAGASISYLQSFYNMITLAFGQLQPAEASYAQYANSIVGRPLALVNIAMSLELAAYPLQNESTVAVQDPRTLLPPPPGSTLPPTYRSRPGAGAPSGSTEVDPPQPVQQYDFPLQLGDQQRSYDGLVGFWKSIHPMSMSVSDPSDSSPGGLESSFDYTTLYTFWPDPPSSSSSASKSASSMSASTGTSVLPILPTTLSLTPFLVGPDAQHPDKSWSLVPPVEQTTLRNAALRAVSALIDPFASVHAFSGTLPTASVRLPRWAVEAALTKMTAFVHAGPVLLTTSVPDYSDKYQLTPDKPVQSAPTAGTIALPTMKGGTWRWLQPYPVDQNPGSPNYMPLALQNTDSRPRFEKPPYTLAEGFLQLAEPLAKTQEPTSTRMRRAQEETLA
ncbi:hypothetical protein BKA56DRAFT_592746 [Ilyonectria sp. MPI-CAGE-AT-0026]|nr:hypothetical protein BKA56DRAFT_592746 [Ilyonectria sp. MPI-CAGE-AT-0026]